MASSHTQADWSRCRHHSPNAEGAGADDTASDGATSGRGAPGFTVYMPKVLRNCSFTSGMPLVISSSVGRTIFISSSGLAPGAGLLPLVTGSAGSLAWAPG